MAENPNSLPFHLAKKKVPYLEDGDEIRTPESPNAIKFERFIFDLLPQANNAVVVEVDSNDHFAPLKNADGTADTDTPKWVRGQISAFHTRRLKEAGAEVEEDAAVEISPLYAIDLDELKDKLEPGTKISDATYLR